MARERLYIVAYDISSPARWRKVFGIMKGYGQWLQLSVFQCRLTKRRKQEMLGRLEKAIKNGEDHVLIMDIGPAETVDVCIESLGKDWRKLEREAIII
jgi:CRISPR-associated protein Cas2